jgi:IstB-like ATP binding protein
MTAMWVRDRLDGLCHDEDFVGWYPRDGRPLPRQRGLTEQTADAAIDTACRMLRLPSIRNEFTEIADRAMKDQMTYRGFLAELLMAECDDRARRRSERRIKAANFPREKSLRTFDFDARPPLRRAPLPGPDRTRGEEQRRYGLQRVLRRLDQDLHRPRLCAAIVDRLTFNGTVIETGTDPYRLASTRPRGERPAKAG